MIQHWRTCGNNRSDRGYFWQQGCLLLFLNHAHRPEWSPGCCTDNQWVSQGAYVVSVVNGDLILVARSSLWTLSWLMNAEQRGGMALNKDFRSKTGNGSVSREGRAIATPTGESCTHNIPPSLIYLFISPLLFYFPYWVKLFADALTLIFFLCLCFCLSDSTYFPAIQLFHFFRGSHVRPGTG